MEYCLLTLAIGGILWGGWLFIQDRFDRRKEYSLYLAVKNQENCLEGIIRNLFRYLHKEEAYLRLVLVVEQSQDQTWAIAQRLSRNFSFELQAVDDVDLWFRSKSDQEDGKILFIDIRNATKGWAEARRIRQHVAASKGCTQIKYQTDGLGP